MVTVSQHEGKAVGLVDDVRDLGSVWEASVEPGDAAGTLPTETWDALMDVGVLRALQPRRFGGAEVRLVDFVDAIVEIARLAPSAGWVAAVIGVHPFQLGLFDDRAQHDMWDDDPTRMHSSSYNPTGSAVPVDGGWEVSGTWSFSSGCDHCEAVNLGAVVAPPEGAATRQRDLLSLLLFRDQYTIVDDWNVAGLKGTGSKSVVVESAFVPHHRTQSHMLYALGQPLPGQKLNDGPVFRLPWSVVFNIALASSVLGAARGFVECWIEENSGRRVPGAGALADDGQTQQRLAEVSWTLDAATTRMRLDAVELWEWAEAGHIATMAERGQKRWNLNRGCDLVGKSMLELFRSASGRALFLDHPLQRRFQDVQAGLSHAYMVPDPVARSVGGTLLGTSAPQWIL